MATSRYNWPLSAPFDPNNPHHQGWAIVNYTGGLLFSPNPNFNPSDEVHRLTLFNRLAGELDSPLRYILRASSTIGNVQAPGHNAAMLIRLPVVGGTPAPDPPPGGWKNYGPEVVVDPTPKPNTVVEVHTPGFPLVVRQLLGDKAVLANAADGDMPDDPAFNARLEATRARAGQGQGHLDGVVGQYVLRKADQLLRTDVAALKDIIDDAILHCDVTEPIFLARIFEDRWNTTLASPGEKSASIKKTTKNQDQWEGIRTAYNLSLCVQRARHRLNTWYNCGLPIAIGGQGVPEYTSVPDQFSFRPHLA